MRNFSKKLAFVLAAAMVVTAFAPAAQAKAADEMAINGGKSAKVLYVNEGLNHKGADTCPEGLNGNVSEYDFYVANKPANYKETHTFKWSSSNEDVITVGKAGLTTAVAVGKAEVVCEVTEKATGKTTTLKKAVTVKANAADVYVSNLDDVDGATVKAGETVDLNRTMVDENGEETTKRGEVVTDYTRWIAEPDTGVTIDQKTGKFTFGEDAVPGDYNLYCETYQSDKYNQTTATCVDEPVVVTFVADNTFTTKQKSISEFTIEFDSVVKTLSKDDVTVEKVRVRNSKEYFTKMPVKTANLAKDGMSATVTLFGSMENANDYKVTVKNFDESDVLTASVGYPEYMVVTAQVNGKDVDPLITGDTADLVCKFYDANDVDVTAKGWPISYSLVEYSKNGGYSLSSGKLTIKKAGEIVGVKAKSQKYENGKLVVDLAETFYFTAKDADPVYAVGIADFSLNGFGSPNKQSLQVDEKGKYTLTVSVIADDGKNPIKNVAANKDGALDTVTGKPGISFTAINPEICNITENGVLIPYKIGTAGFYVNTVTKKSNGEKVVEPFADVYIDVQANSKFDEFKLDKYDVTVGTQDGFDTVTIKATAYDQYDAKFDNAAALELAGVSDNAKAVVDILKKNVTDKKAEKEIKIDGSELLTELNKEGSKFVVNTGDAAYLEFEAKIGSYKQYFTVVVQTPSKSENNYPAIESNNTADALRVYTNNNDSKSEDAKELTFSVYQMNNNIKVANQTVTAYPTDLNTVSEGDYFYKILKNGEELKNCVTPTGNGIKIALSELSDAVSGSAIGAANKTVKYDKTGAGTYTFELYRSYKDKELTQIDSSSVTVSLGDKGEYGVAGQNENKVKITADYDIKGNAFSTNDADKKAIVDCFKFTGRDGKEISKDDFKKNTFDVKYDAANGTGSVFVESVTVYELLGTYDNVKHYVAYEIPVNVVLVREK